MPQEHVDLQVAQLSKAILPLVGEDNSLIQAVFWREALFKLCDNRSKGVWPDAAKIKKDFMPKLSACFKNAGFGAAKTLYENIPVIFSVLPILNFEN